MGIGFVLVALWAAAEGWCCFVEAIPAPPSLRSSVERIYGGGDVAGQEFPFYVQSANGACGGVLVARDVVLTSAGCDGSFNEKVLVGSYRLNNTVHGPSQWRNILNGRVMHPLHSRFTFNYDFMLLQIEPVTLDNLLHPIDLNSDPNVPIPNQSVTVVGYGYRQKDIDDDGQYILPTVLQKATVKVSDNDVCQAIMEYQNQTFYNSSTMLCSLGDTKHGRGPCYFDWGGPIFDSNRSLIGVVSASYPPRICSKPIFPSIYARVSTAVNWIQETTCQLTSGGSSDLPFRCPDFVCPLESKARGYPYASLPSASNSTKHFNDFTISNVTQDPAPGSPIPFDKSTDVTITATDESNSSRSCVWKVTVPPLDYVGNAYIPLPTGSSQRVRTFMSFLDPGETGVMYQLVAELGKRLPTAAAVVTGTLTYNQNIVAPPLVVKAGQKTARVNLTHPVSFLDLRGFHIALNAKNLASRNYVYYYLVAQR